MRAFRSTWMMGLVVALLAGYTAWEYSRAGRDQDSPEEKHLFLFRNDDVEEYAISRPDQELLIVRDADGWKMKKPVEDLVEPTAMDALLYSTVVQRGKTFRDATDGKSIDWAEFGFDKPTYHIRVKTKKETQEIDISAKNAFDGSFYARKGGELLLVEQGFAHAVLREAVTLRTRRLWRDPEATIDSYKIEVNADGTHEQFKIVKTKEGWALDPKPPFILDAKKVEAWATRAPLFVPAEIVAETLSPEQRVNAGLTHPAFVVKAHFKREDGHEGEWVLNMGQDVADEVFMYTNQRTTVYKSPLADVRGLRVSLLHFMDRHAPFRFSVEQVREIHYPFGHKQMVIKKGDLEWKIEDADSKLTLKPEHIVSLLKRLSELEFEEFVHKETPQGMGKEPPIQLLDGNGKILLEVTWGYKYKGVEAFKRDMTLQFVKTNLDHAYLGVAYDAFNPILLEAPFHIGPSPQKAAK